MAEEFLSQNIIQTITSEGVCLSTELKIRMEKYGLYQDVTSRQIDRIIDEKIGKKEFKIYPTQEKPSIFYYDKKLPTVQRIKIFREKLKAYKAINSMLQDRANCGYFAEALFYLALIHMRVKHQKLNITIFPPHDYITWLNGHKYPFDDLFMLQSGKYGVEVKNTFQMLSPKSRRLHDFIQNANMNIVRPVLVSRLSSKELKRFLLHKRGRALDVLRVMICTENNSIFDEHALAKLGFGHNVRKLSLLKIKGEKLNGTQFFQRNKYQKYSFEDLSKVAMKNVPREILLKTDGLIRLLYTTTLIDNAKLSVSHKGEALLRAILASASYNYILAAKGRTISVDGLYAYSKNLIKPPLSYQIQKISDSSVKQMLIQNLRAFLPLEILEEPSKFEFRIKDALHPEEWLKIKRSKST